MLAALKLKKAISRLFDNQHNDEVGGRIFIKDTPSTKKGTQFPESLAASGGRYWVRM